MQDPYEDSEHNYVYQPMNELDLADKNFSEQDLEKIIVNLDFSDYKVINLSGNRLKTIPNCFLIVNLEKFTIENNLLASWIDFSICKSIRIINLNNNKLDEAPNLSDCVMLEELHIADNNLLYPPSLDECINLRYVVFDNNKLKIAPNVTNCLYLEQLHLDFNMLEAPPDLRNSKTLTHLGLTNNLLKIAPNLDNCVTLTYLGLSNNKLTIPPNLTSCHLLENVCMDNNNLLFPPNLSMCENLTYVDLGKNFLEAAPDFSGLTKLQYVALDDNKIVFQPKMANCAKLKSLYLADNLIQKVEIPRSMRLLHDIDFGKNPLSLLAKIGLYELANITINNEQDYFYEDEYGDAGINVIFDVTEEEQSIITDNSRARLSEQQLEEYFGREQSIVQQIVRGAKNELFLYSHIAFALLTLPMKEHLPLVIIKHIMSFLSIISCDDLNRIRIYKELFVNCPDDFAIIRSYYKKIKMQINHKIEFRIINYLAIAATMQMCKKHDFNDFVHSGGDVNLQQMFMDNNLMLSIEQETQEDIVAIVHKITAENFDTRVATDAAMCLHELNNLATDHFRKGNLDIAIQCLQQATGYAKENGNDDDYATINFNMGITYFEKKNLRKAVECLQLSYNSRLLLFGERDLKTVSTLQKLKQFERMFYQQNGSKNFCPMYGAILGAVTIAGVAFVAPAVQELCNKYFLKA